jgi:predicted nucleic-acid-binding Zn-ribbon protein
LNGGRLPALLEGRRWKVKASKRCPKCSSLKVGYLEYVADRGRDNYQESIVGLTEPRGKLLKTIEPVGTLEAYVCAECGYHETYLKDPAAVPFEQIGGFHWLHDVTGAGQPYR